MDIWVNLVSSAGVGGILCWYLYWTTTRTIPGLQESYRASLQAAIDRFTEELGAERATREPLQRTVRRLARALAVRPCLAELLKPPRRKRAPPDVHLHSPEAP